MGERPEPVGHACHQGTACGVNIQFFFATTLSAFSVFMIIYMSYDNVVVWCDLSPGHEPILHCSGIVMLNVHQVTRSLLPPVTHRIYTNSKWYRLHLLGLETGAVLCKPCTLSTLAAKLRLKGLHACGDPVEHTSCCEGGVKNIGTFTS